MTALLKFFARGLFQVWILEELVAEAFAANPGARDEFLDQYLAEAGIHGQKMPAIVREYLNTFTDDLEFVKKTMAGVAKSEIDMPLASSATLDDLVSDHSDKQSDLIIDPMPQPLLHPRPVRVLSATVCSCNRMRFPTRCRETIYADYIFRFHPDFEGLVKRYYDRDGHANIEGGDVLNLTEDTLAIGISQRTQAAAIDLMAQNIFWKTEGCEIEKIFAFDIPASRAFMHLDTVFTQIDVDKFTIHPAIMGTLRVYEMTKGAVEGEVDIKEHTDSLEKILEYATGVDGISYSLRRRRSHCGSPRAVERRFEHPVRRARHHLRVSAQQRHQRGALQGRSQPAGCSFGRAVPWSWRPALHEHAVPARRSLVSSAHQTLSLSGLAA